MSLRTLLGYDPSRRPSRMNYDQTTPSRTVMATQKAKYTAPMSRVRKLPPIHEESGTPKYTPKYTARFAVSTPIPTSEAPPIRRVAKNRFSNVKDGTSDVRVVPVKPVIPVIPMRREPSPPPSPVSKPMYEENVKLKRNDVPLSPSDVNHTLVDGLVADYLHYARYGHIIPVYEGTSANSCPCCTDRNRENVRTLLGFPKQLEEAKHLPRKYDRQSRLPTREDEDIDLEGQLFPNSMYAKSMRPKPKPSKTEQKLKYIAEQSRRQPWVNYQPLPYATNYLNPEFSRPAELHNYYYEIEPYRQNTFVRNQVVEADSDYNTAMSKLEAAFTVNFGSSSYTDYY